jgi:hypothetical protein
MFNSFIIVNNKYTLDRQICEWFGPPDGGLLCSLAAANDGLLFDIIMSGRSNHYRNYFPKHRERCYHQVDYNL